MIMNNEVNSTIYFDGAGRENVYSICYYIDRKNVSDDALSLYLDMLYYSNPSFTSFNKLKSRIESIYGATINIKQYNIKDYRVMIISAFVIEDKYMRTIKNLSSELIEVLNSLYNKGVVFNEEVLNSIKSRAKLQLSNYKKRKININKGLSNLIGVKSFNEYIYSSEEAIDSVGIEELREVNEIFQKSLKKLVVKKTDQANKFNSYFKSTVTKIDLIERYNVNEKKIIDINDLDDQIDLVYGLKELDEKDYLYALILPELVSDLFIINKLNLKVVAEQFLNYEVVVLKINKIGMNKELMLEKILKILDDKDLGVEEKFMNELKCLKTRLLIIQSDVKQYVEFIHKMNNLNLSVNIDDYIKMIDSLSYKEFNESVKILGAMK